VSRVRGGPVPARWLAPPLALLLAACTATEVPPPSAAEDAASPFADCASLSAPPAASSAAAPSAAVSAPDRVAAAVADLPDFSLPCFTGGSPVRLAALRGPAVINLWGSWCEPCRAELPVMQELADATAGRLQVVGVDTRDSRDAGASFAAEKGVSLLAEVRSMASRKRSIGSTVRSS
jgi:cytochrome c biogenesis protein CcmG/thiol:disulfide interchange protein DsbE